MTKKLTGTQLPIMELDLDAFLNSNSASDSDPDSDSHSIPHRTLDEILNDSSPSPSPSSSPLSRKPPPFSSDQIPRSLSDAVPLDSTPSLDSSSLPQTQQPKDEKPDRSKPNNGSFSRAKSAAGFSGDPIWRVPSSSSLSSSSNSRPLPSLFGGVRSNAKPGAALAAAAAASRSVPTPHAAAIKSRRATSSAGSLGMVGVDPGESGSSVAGDDHEIVSVSSSNGGGSSVGGVEKSKSGERLLEENDSVSDYQSGVDNEISMAKSSTLENSTEEHSVEFSSSILDSKAENENENENLIATATDENLELSGANDSGEVDVPSASWMDEKDGKKEEDSTLSPPVEGDDVEKDVVEGEGDDASSMSDVSELVAERLEQLESEMISRRAEKKMRSIMKPLELAEEHEKRQASTGLHLEEGAAAQPMRLEGVKRGSTTLGYFDTDTNNVITRAISSQGFMRDHGSPQVLAISLNHVAVGMSKGVIVVVPSRHTPHTSDTMDAKMMMLGGQGDRSHSPVTSMCFNQQGDLLLAGYADGHITVWEVLRASPAKVITGEHTSPVVHTLFLGQDSQVTRQFKAVTGDSKGLVLLHSFSVVPLLNRFNIKTQCLLDGQRTGTVLSASPLLFEESTGGGVPSSQGNAPVPSSSIGSMMGGVVGGESGWKLFNEGSSLGEEGVVVFATFQTALVVRLSPTLQIYAQLSKPDGVREGSVPYTAWKSTVLSSESSTDNVSADAAERVSLLAVAWDRKVQVAKLVKSELKVYGKWSLDSTAIGVTWLDSHMLVVLTSTGQLYLFAKDGTVIHQTSFLLDVSGGDELVAYHTHFLNVFGNPEKAYHNSIAVRGASIYILGPMRLILSRLLPWKERIQVLRRAGDWMGALNMAMTLYDGQAHGVIDLPRSLDAVQETIMPYLVELLFSYVDEVFSYISVAFCNQIGKVEQEDDSKSGSNSVRSEIKEQYTRVGGVAVEFCVHIQRTDILFDEIFSRFLAVQQRDTFLELLEPYILKDMLGSLPPEIMQALVEHYSSKGWLQRVEQCVLHMDISSLDFNQVVRLCREHGLYSALVYLFNKGLDDFRAPLEELLMVWQKSPSESAAALGYKMLVYLKYCFLGLAFPPGRGPLPAERLPSLRTELVRFLLENSENLNSQAKSISSFRGPYLNLYHLLELDTEATLDVLRCAFVDDEQENVMTSSSQNLLAQNTVDALIPIIEGKMSQADHCMSNEQAWPSKKDIGHIFEYISCYVACRKACVTMSVLSQILEYLTSESDSHPNCPVHNIQPLKKKEKQMLALLEAVPETDWNPSYVLQLCEKADFHQVCGLIHTFRHQYLAALDSYLKDVDEPIHIFAYINNTLQELHNNDYDSFRSAVMSRIPEMLVISREGTFFLVIEHFNNASSYILSELQSQPKSLFLYLKTVVEVYLSGTLNFSYLVKNDYADAFDGRTAKDQSKGLDAYLQRISDFPKIIRSNPVQVTDDMIELYLELLCQYERNSVLKFLETFDSYRVEHCLRLCQEYGIVDAAAFLLERVGDVGSALSLMISGLNDKFPELDTAVGSLVSDKPLSGPASVRHYSAVSKMKEVDEIRSILHACIGLCRRNTPRLRPEESETLWFRLLDSFCEPLMDSSADKGSSSENNHSGMVSENFGSPEDDESCIIKWRISKFHKNARILRKLFSQFIKEIVEGMIGYVRLPTIMSKLLSDNGSQEFGDFKNTILGMLGTYGFERRILDTAKSLIEDDTFYTMNVLKKGASHGYAPRSLECCICNCLLTKTSSSLGIRVFSCGHATHLQCELESESSSRGSLSGCPVCMPKKNTQWPRNKSVHAEHGLVNKVSTRMKRAQGAGVFHPHDESSSESSYGLQQISRFEFLANLQKDQRLVQIENMPQLKLAPPAVYHEKVKKGSDLLVGASSSNLERLEKASRKLREPKGKGSSLRFPLKSSIFGKEKINKR